MQKGLILVHATDNAAVALGVLKKGETYDVGGQPVTLLEDIPFGHKVTLHSIAAGGNAIKYGNPLGHAVQDIPHGSHIHTHNLKTNLPGHINYQYLPDLNVAALFGAFCTDTTFEGYPGRTDAQVCATSFGSCRLSAAGLIHNPNAGSVLVLSLGCENNNPEIFRPYLGEIDENRIISGDAGC